MKKTKLTALVGDKEYPIYVDDNERLYILIDGEYKYALCHADRILYNLPKEK